jgi:hypothetical protein
MSGAPQEDGVAGEDDEDDDAGRQVNEIHHGSTPYVDVKSPRAPQTRPWL